MSAFKKSVCAAVSAGLLLTSLALSGCSTPAVAMTVDGKDYSSGEYLAYLYNAYYNVFYTQQQLAMYAAYQDVWSMDLSYGESEETAVKLKPADYIKQAAQDTIIRQKAIENKLKEAGLEWREEDIKTVDEAMAQVKEDQYIDYGISKASFEKMYRAINCNETALFYGTYDKGGAKAMTEEEIRRYFDENFLSYKIIEMSLTDSEGKDLSADEKKKVTDQLQKYLDQYKTGKDFDKVIETYNADEQAKTAASNSSASSSASTPASTASTAPATTATTPASSAASSSATSPTGTSSTGGGDSEEETETDPNRRDIDANTYGDEDFTNAIKSVKIDEAKIVEYKKNGSSNTAALILRLDPEKREGGENYFKENRNSIIYGAKFEEYNKELTEYSKTLAVDINKRAVKAFDPKKFAG